ncbi:MAG: PspC domain-containing protein [Bacteroidetes bacterium]|nr:PspC domain-containing protein [Bacteroidota bacterium]MCL2302955.1 PspC domain-containing protein [Lentimicrobiaceae bacterium]
MKKVITANIGGFCFVVEEDAYARLDHYLNSFRATISNKQDIAEIMEDIEARMAEIFHENLRSSHQVVDMKLVDRVISQLGYPEDAPRVEEHRRAEPSVKAFKRLFRDPDNTMLGGVCSGLGAYFDVDLTLVRVIFLVALFFGGLSFWVYIIMWIVVPKAHTIAEKLQMRGEAVTAENISNFSRK